MTKLEKDVRSYFDDCISKEEFENNNVNTLVFSFLTGTPPEECKYMELETEMEQSMIDDYYNVEGIIHRMIKERG